MIIEVAQEVAEVSNRPSSREDNDSLTMTT